MKKRRELDALVSKPTRSTKAKNGNHELLRNDSYSSEGEEYALPEKLTSTKKPRPHYCLMCLLIFGIIMLLSCFAVMGGLMWMLIQVKTEVQDLKLQISKVESSMAQKMQDFVMKEIETNSQLINLKMKNIELSKVASSILSLRDETIADDKSSLKALNEKIIELKKYKVGNQESFTKLQEEFKSFQEMYMKFRDETKKALDSVETKVEASRNNVTNGANTLESEIFAVYGAINALNSSLSSLTEHTSSLESRILKIQEGHLLQNKTRTNGSTSPSEMITISKTDEDSMASASVVRVTSLPSLYSSEFTFANKIMDGN